ncbi:uncharacterized protein [Engystomops pustulosus]|uniref:uncharacterized protein isoform X1 n=1 Tax=Engystomops pustulosus TaxID=76066 RepID=UPI003AFB6A2B
MDAGYSPDYGSFYASIPPEELLRRLAFCAGLLPSPLFKMERLMPTNPAAQQQFLRKEEEEPPRARAMDRTLLLRAAMVRELFADSDEEEERPCFIKPQMKKREREEDSEEDAEPPRRRRMRQPSTCRFPLSHQRRSWLKILLPGSHYLISARRLLQREKIENGRWIFPRLWILLRQYPSGRASETSGLLRRTPSISAVQDGAPDADQPCSPAAIPPKRRGRTSQSKSHGQDSVT